MLGVGHEPCSGRPAGVCSHQALAPPAGLTGEERALPHGDAAREWASPPRLPLRGGLPSGGAGPPVPRCTREKGARRRAPSLPALPGGEAAGRGARSLPRGRCGRPHPGGWARRRRGRSAAAGGRWEPPRCGAARWIGVRGAAGRGAGGVRGGEGRPGGCGSGAAGRGGQ